RGQGGRWLPIELPLEVFQEERRQGDARIGQPARSEEESGACLGGHGTDKLRLRARVDRDGDDARAETGEEGDRPGWAVRPPDQDGIAGVHVLATVPGGQLVNRGERALARPVEAAVARAVAK